MLAAAIIGSAMTFIDGSVVNVVLPVLRMTFGASLSAAQWIVEAYMLFLSSLMLVGGALGDRWGRRFVFVMGIGLFALASGWCGMATNINQLVVARGLQGIGAALLVPGSLALISANFERKDRGRAIGTWAGFTSISAGTGPLIGAWLVEHLSWRWIFFINLPLAIVVLLIVRVCVPESRGGAATGRIDWIGAALGTVGLFGLVFGLIEGGGSGFRQFRVYASLALGVVAIVAFVLAEAYQRHPMMPLSLFRSRTFAATNILTLFLYCALGATLFIVPFFLIDAEGYTVMQAAAAMMPSVIVMFVLSRWSGGLLDRYGPRLPLTVGPSVAALGFLLLARAAAGGPYWTTIFPAVMVMSIGMAITVAPLTTAVMTSVDESMAGLASGINNAVSRLATLFAVAIVGVIVTGSFRTGLIHVGLLSATLALAAAATAALLIRSDRQQR